MTFLNVNMSDFFISFCHIWILNSNKYRLCQVNSHECKLKVKIHLIVSQTFMSKSESSETWKCPATHPYVYYNGQYCCQSDREKVYTPQGDKCDGSAIQTDSLCCEGDKYIQCPSGNCTSLNTATAGYKLYFQLFPDLYPIPSTQLDLNLNLNTCEEKQNSLCLNHTL